MSVTPVGGHPVLPDELEATLEAHGLGTVRPAGEDRYAIAAALAEALAERGGDTDIALFAKCDPAQSDRGWPDASAAGAACPRLRAQRTRESSLTSPSRS